MPSVEIALVYCGEHTYLRLFLASLKRFYAGFPIKQITVLTGQVPVETLSYLLLRHDINVITFPDISGVIPIDSDIYDRFMRHYASADYVIWMHPDAIPIRDNWAIPVYTVAKNNYMGTYIIGNSPDSPDYFGTDALADIICFDTKFYKENRLSSTRYEKVPYPLFPQRLLGYQIGYYRNNMYFYDLYTYAMGVVMALGYNPIVDYHIGFLHENYICHIGSGGVSFGVGMDHLQNLPVIEAKKHRIKQLFLNPDYRELYHFIDLIRNDGYPTFLPDPVLEIVIDAID